MRINVRLYNPSLKENDDIFARAVRLCCEAAIFSNRIFLRRNPQTPPLYRSGVVWKNEPIGLPDELLDIPAILARKWGDCMHVACWRVAELRERGEKARVAFTWRTGKKPDGVTFKLFHVIVRRGDGKLEDPSRKLGM